MFVVLCGGVGGARFLRGLVAEVGPERVTAIVNVADDLERVGLRICPDLDTVVYWLAGVVHPEQQWGRDDERFVVAEELERFGHERWFTLGDRDIALHLHRTALLRDGTGLAEATRQIASAFGVDVRVLPATDSRIETRVTTADGRDLAFQEYWVRERAAPHVADVRVDGASGARPAPGVVEAIAAAETLLIAPSNPVVSIAPILAVDGIREAVDASPAPVVGVSPIVGGAVVRGMADRLLPAMGAEVSASGVAHFYGDLLDGWIVDAVDVAAVAEVDASGVACRSTDTLMDELAVARALARTCLDLADELRR